MKPLLQSIILPKKIQLTATQRYLAGLLSLILLTFIIGNKPFLSNSPSVVSINNIPEETSQENPYLLSNNGGNSNSDNTPKLSFSQSGSFAVLDSASALAVYSPSMSSLSFIAQEENTLSNRQGITDYIVRKGDTIERIAKRFQVSTQTILAANNLSSKSIIRPGQSLIILPISGIRYRVAKGDTLSRIAHHFHSSVKEIVVFNNLKNESSIIQGQTLIIPGGYGPSKAKTSFPHGLTPNTPRERALIKSWPSLPGYFSYPTVAGDTYDIGILHHLNAVDISGSCGTPIYAAAAGFIDKITRNNRWYGNEIRIVHHNGTYTVYAHLSKILAKEGGKVEKGQIIGRMGQTGNANGCHLHFEVHGAQNPFVKHVYWKN